MGCGIWSMHYLGMLAVKLPVEVYHYWPTVVLSLLLAIATSAVALTVASADRVGWRRLVLAGALMGAGVGGMHYVGMAAMLSSAMEEYEPWLVALSLVAAVGFSAMALWILFNVRDRDQQGVNKLRIAAGCVMGIGISSMHYIAMRAVHFVQDEMPYSLSHTVRVNALGVAGIALIAFLLISVALAAASIQKRSFANLQSAHATLERAQNELLTSQEQLREMNSLLTEMSTRDGLTGLYNRRHFDAILATEWSRAALTGNLISPLMIDVDFFKSLNDTYGHPRGDECLRHIAMALNAPPRRGYDLIAPYGGEEFVVLLPGASADVAAKIGETIRKSVHGPGVLSEVHGNGRIASVSIGVCCLRPQMMETSERLMLDADNALYSAKRCGKNRVEIAPESVLTGGIRAA